MLKKYYMFFLPLVLFQCQNINEISSLHTQNPNETLVPISASETPNTGCVLPPTIISDKDIRYFNWSENGEFIFYKEFDSEIWYRYNISSSQIDIVSNSYLQTPTLNYDGFNIKNFNELFLSPSEKTILFTRGKPSSYDVYYKLKNNNEEFYIGKINGEIETIEWFNKDEEAIIAMDWQSPAGIIEAHAYIVNFSNKTIAIEIPQSSNYGNIQYLDLTPDETQIMFVEYNGNPIVKMWDISTNNITLTPVFNPLDFRWISTGEFVSVGYQVPDSFPYISVIKYNINSSKMTFLAESSFHIQPFIRNGLLSPNGSAIGYIENETNNLFWTLCKQ